MTGGASRSRASGAPSCSPSSPSCAAEPRRTSRSLQIVSRLANFLAEWLGARRHTVAPQTWTTYECKVRRHFLPRLGQVRLQQLDRLHVQRLNDALLDAGCSAQPVNHIDASLRRALKDAMRWNLVDRKDAGLVDSPRVTRTRFLTPWEAPPLPRGCCRRPPRSRGRLLRGDGRDADAARGSTQKGCASGLSTAQSGALQTPGGEESRPRRSVRAGLRATRGAPRRGPRRLKSIHNIAFPGGDRAKRGRGNR